VRGLSGLPGPGGLNAGGGRLPPPAGPLRADRGPRIGLWQRVLGNEATLWHFGWLTLAASLGLTILGIYAIDVATVSQPTGLLGPRAWTQVVYACAGILAAAIVVVPHPHTVRYLAWPALLGCLVLLVFLLLPFVPASIVRPRNGCRGWIDLGRFDLQPSELAKVAFVLASAEYLRYSRNHRTVRGLIPPAVITAVPVGLIMLQPDLGMALLFGPAVFAMLLAAGAKLRHLSVVVLAGVLAVPTMFPLLKPYQQQRIMALFRQIKGDAMGGDPELYQSQSAMTLIGAGGAMGYGDAKARAVIRASRLPERHNDMVFSVVAARFGIVGGLATIGLLGLWIAGALLTAAACRDPFGRLICVGFAGFIAAQATINIGMNVGVLPIIGITLPFVSSGGSSMLSVWLMTGLVFSVACRRAKRIGRGGFDFDAWE
jgi:cell division protein FtsW (lipid II flippase)